MYSIPMSIFGTSGKKGGRERKEKLRENNFCMEMTTDMI
jgi:hypothetical protein